MQSVQEELRGSRERLVASFRDGGVSSEFQAQYTEMVDHYFRRSLEESRAGQRLFRARKAFSLVAVGGYGRADLCLASDIDLLLLFSSKVPPDAKSLVEEILFPLWDQGLDLGYAVRSLKECVRLAKTDFEVLTALLDARFVGGDSPLFLKLLERVREQGVARKRERFARWLEETDNIRLETIGDASHLLEPDLKKGIGGLRDVHHMAWLSMVRHGLGSLRELETTGRLSHPEYQDLEQAASLIRLVRNHLHDLSGRKNDRLTFEHQPEIARRLGYRDRPHFPAVEQFMGDLHAAMGTVKGLARVVKAGPARGTGGPGGAVPAGLPPGLTARGDGIGFQSAAAVLEHPLLLMQAFEASATSGVPLSLETLRLVREFLPLVDDAFRTSEDASRGFREVLRSKRAADTLDPMFETRFLDAYIPELGSVRDRVQFDTYHLFPVGRHSVETVRSLEQVGRQKEILLAGIYLDLPDPERLLLAALLHDIGKSGRDHARRGAGIAGPILRRLGLDRRAAEEVAFLIRNHLLLVETAARRDLGDEKIVVGCARTVGTIERLKMLYLLTWADARATGPRAWNDWVASLVQELFFKVLHILERGELASPDASKRAEEVRRKVLRTTRGKVEESLLQRAFEGMTPRYLLSTHPDAMARQIELLGRLEGPDRGDPAAFVIDPRPDPALGWWEVSFLARDRPGLFSLIAGVFALNSINILSSEIYTWREGTAVDLFRVTLPGAGRTPEEVWDRVADDLKGALAGRLSLAERLERKAAPSILTRPGRPRRPAEVRIDNGVSDFFTLVDVFADDRVGLLYDVTRTLTELGLDIRIAKISTKGDQVADAFYVRDLEGQKVEDPERVRRIEKALLRRLERRERADGAGAA